MPVAIKRNKWIYKTMKIILTIAIAIISFSTDGIICNMNITWVFMFIRVK